jgi:hypothetical protein
MNNLVGKSIEIKKLKKTIRGLCRGLPTATLVDEINDTSNGLYTRKFNAYQKSLMG